MTTHNARLGSISHGTMRTADLLERFASELDWLRGNHEATDAKWSLATDDGEITDSDAAQDLLNSFFDDLDALAPAYCYFGANEGDGADYGFWPSMDAIEELPRVNDPSEVPDGGTGEDLLFVNDHGNVTVYSADGRVILELV